MRRLPPICPPCNATLTDRPNIPRTGKEPEGRVPIYANAPEARTVANSSIRHPWHSTAASTSSSSTPWTAATAFVQRRQSKSYFSTARSIGSTLRLDLQ